MLKELITSDKIRVLNHVDSWQSAIAGAAQPLVLLMEHRSETHSGK